MNFLNFLQLCHDKAIRFSLDNEQLKVNAPKDTLKPEIVALLRQYKPQVIDWLNTEAAARQAPRQARIEIMPRDQMLPVSFGQEQFWLSSELEDSGDGYHFVTTLEFVGTLNIPALQSSFDTILARHESLRTVFFESEGQLYQRILPACPVPMPLHQASHLGQAEQAQCIALLQQQLALAPFDLRRDLMLRLQLVQVGPQHHILLMVLHHIASDGWSLGILVQEFQALYQAAVDGVTVQLPPLPVQYADYAAMLRQPQQAPQQAQQLAWWSEKLEGVPEVHHLPLDFPRPQQPRLRGACHIHRIDAAMTAALKQQAQRSGVTLFMLLESLFALLIVRYSQQDDVVIGTPVANRSHAQVEGLIGYFVNMLALRHQIHPDWSLKRLLEESRQQIMDAFSHQDCPFDMVVRAVVKARNSSYNPLLQIAFVLQNNDIPALNLPGVSCRITRPERQNVMFDLQLEASEDGDGIDLRWEYATELFAHATIERMAGHFIQLTGAALASPDAPLSRLKILSPAEQHYLLHELNATASAPLNVTCVHDWFEREAASHPDAIALVFGEQQLTYHELNLQANRLAHYLLDQRALQAESLVGICLDRSLQMVVALLAVVKAGGAYVPLDPNYPAARLAYMVSDASLHTILTTAALWQPLSDQLPVPAGQVLCLDLPDLQQGLASQSGDNIDLQRVGLSSQSLVYLIYTSGSTGNPKGVMIEHGGLCNTIADNSEQFLVDRQSVFLQSISLNFDAASWVIWMTLSRGGELVIADDAVRMGQGADVAINEGEITHIMMTPSSLALLDPASVHGLRSVIVGGEACSPALAAKWLPHVCFFNAYGPTEASICTNVSKVQQADLITIGKPVRNMAMYVVDRHLQLTPPGVAGELLIGGAGLARGYLHRPELDAEKFIPNPFHDAQPSGTEVPHCPRLYRSGDWVRWLADGSLAFSGRIDDQVKIRGFRIELGEIENALRHLPFIKDAAVLAKPTGHGDQQLVAYLVVRSASEAEQINSGPELIARARQALAASLPEYMVPAVLLILSVLPLTPNGKVDRKALPEPDFSLLRGSFIAPVTPIEQTLCQLYQEILGVSQVGLEDNFFLLGGHSLSATRLLAGISQQLHLDVPLKTLFHAQTVAELAGILQHMAPALDWPPLVAVPRNQALPLSYAQQRLWLLDRIDGGSALYNIPGSLALHGKLDQEAMNYAFAKIVARHESLRTCFSADDDGTPLQIIMPARPFAISEVDLSALSPQQQAVRVPQLVAEEALRIFDLRKDLMLRASLLKLGEQDYLLLVSMHHIAADGWSMAVLFREFSMLYAAHLAGQRDPLPALALQYADYACWQRNWLQGERLQRQLDYWRTQLADLPLVHGLPLDFPRPKRQTFGGQTVRSEIDADTSKRLLALCQQHGATLFMGLHAVFSALLARYSNENDIVIGSPIANREQAQVADLIGFFVNILVLRSDVSGDPDFVTLLERSKRTLFDAYAHQQVPFEQVVERLQPERSLSHSPLFQIMLVLQNNQQAELELPGLSMGALLQTGNIAKYDLALTATESDSGLKLEWEFNTGLFEAATIVRMARHFEALLLACLDRVHAGVMLHNMLGADELQQQMLDWNRTAGDFPATQCLHQLFEAQVLKDPFAIAVSHKLEHISFAELNARANRLARYLRSTRTIAPDSLIGICVERSVNMVVGILAILKAGAAYVPLDPDYPATRLAYMLTEARLDTVLTQSSLLARLNLHGADSVVLDDPLLQEKLALQADSNLPPGEIGLHSRHLAYVIYTSGSTGNPKGVMIEHRSLVNLVCCDRDLFDLNGRSRLLNPLSIGFDAGNGYVWDALCNGAHLVLHAADESLFTLIAAQQITHAVMPAALLQVQKITPCDSLQVLISGGDACNPEVLSKFGPATRFFNVYGPTENTVTSTCQQILPGQTVGIGRPLANMVAYVLSPQMVLLPRGCVGQLHVGGIGLARGYLHRPDLTDEKFVSNPFFGQSQVDSSPLLYKTGDLVRWLPDGNLEFLGRIDHQVKIRGFRIELGDIESALLAQASVKEAVVQAQIFANGEKRLVAYVVPEGEGPALATAPDQAAQQDLIDAILQKLSQAVPEYMVPSVVMLLPAMPLTPNGKIDKKALPASTVLPRQALVAPRNQIEQRLCTIWCDLLGLEQVGVHENFFESGGNSLLAIKAQGLISEQFGLNLTVADLFAWPTISSLASFLHAQQQEEVDDEDDAEKTPQRSPHDSASQARATDIAIIGMAGRFPGAADIDAFWQNISAGVESIRTFTEEELLAAGVDPALMQHPDYVRTGTLLEERDMFDAGYFGFTPREAEITCPQQRLLLEVSVQTLEHAGYGQQPAGQRVGVFVGATSSLYLFKHLMPNAELRHSMGMGGLMLAADKDFIASRIAYKLNLTGPAVSLNTACSTSLVAISQACMNLVQNQCDMALAGAATLQLLSTEGYLYQDGGIYSPDGHCYPFDQRARGTRAGSGAGMVLLKRLDRALADGDTIHGVILGVGINNDGKFKVGYTAPSVQGQAGAIRDALRMAAVAPSSIRYIETHGTATSIGDPIEVAALMKAYKPRAAALPHGDLVALGALKANIGHLDTAAGIAGLIKTLQALKAHKFPANINFSQANQQIDFANSPFYVNTVMKDWPAAAEPRRAAVSSFGIGGTNAHLIVQEAPAQSPGESHRHSHLLLLSAKTRSSLLLAAAQLRQWLAHQLLSGASGAESSPADSAMPDLHAVAYTLQVGREAHACRHAMVCDSIEGAITALDQCESLLPQEMPEPGRVAQGKPVVFMFPGQGSQYVGMTAGLYEQEPLFRELIDYCVTRLEAESIPDLRKLMFAQGSEQEQARAQLQQTRYAQPALFVVQYALARLWMSFGVRPAAMIGHSVGEYVAACLAGVFSLDDGLTLIAARARLMQSAPAGKMLSVHATADTLKPILAAMAEGRATDGGSGGDIPEFAAINSPQNCVLSGSFAAIEQVQARLDALKITHAGLRTSHAFHSSMMDDMLDSYRQVLEQVVLRAPQLDYISNLDGLPVDPAQVIRPDYWLRHLRQCVAFSDGIRTLLADEAKILLEVGPGRTLASLVRKHAGAGQHTVLCSMRHEQDASPDQNVLLQTLGQLWQNGVGIDWAGFHARNRCRRIALPGYVFERESYWIEAGSSASPAQIDTSQPQNWLYTAQWQKQPVSRQLASTLPPQVWLIVHEAQGGLGRLLAQRLRNQGQVVIDVFAGTAFAQTATHSYQVQWQQRGDFDALLAALVQQQCVPQRVLHLAGLPDPVPGVAGLSAHYSEAEFAVSQSGPCLSVLYLAQALARMQQAAATDAATEAATAKDHPPSAIATATAPDKAHRRGAAQPPLEFNLVSVGQASVSGAETLLPDAATAIGLASAIRAECPQLNLLHIDLDSGFEPERTAERIVAEVSAQQRQPWLALRGHGRWIRHFAQHASEQVENGNSRLKPGAVVLITGGMGRVGLHLAQLLATRVQARLVLTGRTAVPPRQQWHALQAEGNPEGLLVQQLMALEAAGASLLLCQADCADLAQMRAVWQQAEAAFGRIDGVIHAAAELGTALTPFDQVNALHLHQQAHAKIRGVLVLEALLQEKSPDFCLLLSSMLTLLGSSGLAAYTAANSFMDVFVQNKQAQGDERWLILNSDWWDFIGNGGNEQVFTLAEASALVARLLALPQAAPLYLSRQDLNQRLTRGPLERKTRKERKKTAPAKGGSREHIAPSSPVEATLVGIWQELIGIEQIGVRDNFFDIGGDSLLATRLISMVHEQFGTGKNDLSLKMLFDQPYIENLAQAISDSAERRKLAQTRSSLGEMAESDVEEGEI